jgi:hypothetical protein
MAAEAERRFLSAPAPPAASAARIIHPAAGRVPDGAALGPSGPGIESPGTEVVIASVSAVRTAVSSAVGGPGREVTGGLGTCAQPVVGSPKVERSTKARNTGRNTAGF